MLQMKKLTLILIMALIFLCDMTFINADYLGQLQYFESVQGLYQQIGSFVQAPQLHVTYGTGAEYLVDLNNVSAATSTEIYYWNTGGVPISRTYNYVDGSIKLYAAPYSVLIYTYGIGLGYGDFGATDYNETDTGDYYIYNGITKNLKQCNYNTKIGINLTSCNSECGGFPPLSFLKNVIGHEIGHSLGFFGHSSSLYNDRIMHPEDTACQNPSTYDLRHLSQIH